MRSRAVGLVPAAGTGARMRSREPKQFLVLGGAPVLVHALRRLAAADCLEGSIILVPPSRLGATRTLLHRHRVPRVLAVLEGGAERQESVRFGLNAVPEDMTWVVIHDAVRPFVTPGLVADVLAAARSTGAATAGLPVRDTVKRVRGGCVEATLDREGLWLVQTPQAFRRDLLVEAHDKALRDGYLGTDDAVLVERLGARVTMVPGLTENVKITTPADLEAARRWIRRPSPGRA